MKCCAFQKKEFAAAAFEPTPSTRNVSLERALTTGADHETCWQRAHHGIELRGSLRLLTLLTKHLFLLQAANKAALPLRCLILPKLRFGERVFYLRLVADRAELLLPCRFPVLSAERACAVTGASHARSVSIASGQVPLFGREFPNGAHAAATSTPCQRRPGLPVGCPVRRVASQRLEQ